MQVRANCRLGRKRAAKRVKANQKAKAVGRASRFGVNYRVVRHQFGNFVQFEIGVVFKFFSRCVIRKLKLSHVKNYDTKSLDIGQQSVNLF